MLVIKMDAQEHKKKIKEKMFYDEKVFVRLSTTIR